MLLGLMGAMPEEMEMIIGAIDNVHEIERGSRKYYRGNLFGQEVVAVFSRWGKVAAATTATHLILEFGVDCILFTGIAGGISPEMQIGDVVIAEKLYQHDMDARPLMQRFEIPLTGRLSFEASEKISGTLFAACQAFLQSGNEFCEQLSQCGFGSVKAVRGDVASGDLFISSESMKNALKRNLPTVVCAEMEGAAVAQVCHDYDIPLGLVRVISDVADEQAHHSAMEFVLNHAGEYSLSILREYIRLIQCDQH